MGSSCVTVPTLTTTSVQVVRSTETIINTSTSVAPPQTTVFTSRSVICPSSSPSTSTTTPSASASPPPARRSPSCTTETLAITSVIPGSSATFQVTQTNVVLVTNLNVNTLFSTLCTAVASSPNSPTPPSSTTSSTSSTNVPKTSQGTSTSPSSGTPGTSSDSRGTPPDPSVTSRSRSDTSPGTSKTSTTTTSSGIVITATSVATIAGSGGSATTVTLTSTFTSSSLSSSAAAPGGSHTLPPKIGAIVGGSVGGFFAFIAIVFIISLFLRRRPKYIDDPVVLPMSINNGSAHAPAPEPTRQPYEYGRVGHSPPWQVVQTSPPTSISSGSPSNTYPSSPIVGLQQYHSAELLAQQVGLSQGQTRSRLASTSSGSHYTQPSLTSLSSRPPGAEQVLDGLIPTMPDVPGGGRPIIQNIPNSLNIGRIHQGQPGPSSVNQGIGATEDGSATGPSGAASQGYYPPPQAGTVVAPGHMPRPSVSEFDAYQAHHPSLSPRTAQRDGKGRLVTTTASGKGQGVHLDGGQYTGSGRPERPMSSVTATAPPAYTA